MIKSKVFKIAGHSIHIYVLPTLIYISVMPVLLALGSWQLQRADEKQRLFAQIQQNSEAKILGYADLDNVNSTTLRYKQIQLTGHYDQSHQFLLDNQINEGKAGYFVMTPFIVQVDKPIILINRGWIPLVNKDRRLLPDLPVQEKMTTITGRINSFPSIGIKLSGIDIVSDSWPSIIQIINHETLGKKLNQAVLPFQIELDKNQPDGFKRDWQALTIMKPEQHHAYAFQWFALAFTLTVLIISYHLKNQHD